MPGAGHRAGTGLAKRLLVGHHWLVRAIASATLVAVVLLGSSPTAGAAARPTTTAKRTVATTKAKATTPRLKPAVAATRLAQDLFRRVNQERHARQLAPLAWDPALASIALQWSGHLATAKFEHRDIAEALSRPEFDHLRSIGENIAMMPRRPNTGRELHRAWMSSDGHRQNLLRQKWDSIGIGVFCDSKGNAWATQDFGRRLDSAAPTPDPADVMPSRDPITANSLDGLSC